MISLQQRQNLIELLDQHDGESDIEDDDEDRCLAYDDTGSQHHAIGGGPGDSDDAEEDNEDCCVAHDDIGTGDNSLDPGRRPFRCSVGASIPGGPSEVQFLREMTIERIAARRTE